MAYGLVRSDGSDKPAKAAVESAIDAPVYVLGFKALADLIPEIVGYPLVNEYHSANGDALQQTSTGLMVWRKADNWTAFTDGYRTWINGPLGLQTRLNTELFDWERPNLTPVHDVIGSLPVAPWNELIVRPASAIKLLIVHWDGGARIAEDYDPLTYYQWEARYHIAKDWGGGSYGYGLMYHEVVSRQGEVFITRPPEHVVWAATRANNLGYMIKVDASVGQPPTEAQLRALGARLDARSAAFGLAHAAVWGHGELTQYGNSTSCPGPTLLQYVYNYRKT